MTFTRKVPAPGKARGTVKLRATSIDISYEGEMPEEVAATIAFALCSMAGVAQDITGSTLAQGITLGSQAAKNKKD